MFGFLFLNNGLQLDTGVFVNVTKEQQINSLNR